MPVVAEITTVAASADTTFPPASRKVTVTVVDEDPFATREASATAMVEVVVEGPATVNVTEPVVALL